MLCAVSVVNLVVGLVDAYLVKSWQDMHAGDGGDSDDEGRGDRGDGSDLEMMVVCPSGMMMMTICQCAISIAVLNRPSRRFLFRAQFWSWGLLAPPFSLKSSSLSH